MPREPYQYPGEGGPMPGGIFGWLLFPALFVAAYVVLKLLGAIL